MTCKGLGFLNRDASLDDEIDVSEAARMKVNLATGSLFLDASFLQVDIEVASRMGRDIEQRILQCRRLRVCAAVES